MTECIQRGVLPKNFLFCANPIVTIKQSTVFKLSKPTMASLLVLLLHLGFYPDVWEEYQVLEVQYGGVQ